MLATTPDPFVQTIVPWIHWNVRESETSWNSLVLFSLTVRIFLNNLCCIGVSYVVHGFMSYGLSTQIIYSKLNLKIKYPSPYTGKIWDCNRSETDLINHSIESFDWSNLFSGKNVHEQIELFNKIPKHFIPNKIIVDDDRDPPWMNNEITKIIKRKSWLFQSQRKSCNLDFAILNSLTQDISHAIF